MEKTTTLRPVFGRIITALIAAIGIAVIVSLIATGQFRQLGLSLSPVLLTVYVVWMLFWAPCVRLSPAGVELVNIIRTQTVSWPAIQRIETKYALTLYASDRKYVAWAAPAPSRFAAMSASRRDIKGLPESTFSAENRIGLGDLPTSDSGAAAMRVRRAWEGYRDAGLLGPVEGTGVTTTWHPVIIAVFGILVVGTVLSIAL
jgi:hypothetical protein